MNAKKFMDWFGAVLVGTTMVALLIMTGMELADYGNAQKARVLEIQEKCILMNDGQTTVYAQHRDGELVDIILCPAEVEND